MYKGQGRAGLAPAVYHLCRIVDIYGFSVWNAVLGVPLGLLWFLTNPPSFASQMPPPLPKEANEAVSYCMGSLEYSLRLLLRKIHLPHEGGRSLPVGLRIDLILFNDFDEKRREQAPAMS